MTDKIRSNHSAERSDDHPDQREINDWLLYGPKNGQIEELVRELTLVRGLRLSAVEGLIISALEEQRQSLSDKPTQP